MIRWARRILIVLILVAGAGYLIYGQWLRPIEVVGHEVVRGDLVIEVIGTGTVQARTSTVISAKIQGRLLELTADQGDRVAAGELLARLDDSDLARQVEIAQANVEVAEASLDRLRADRSRAGAVLRHAQRDDERIREAYAQGAATEMEIDKSEEQVAIAQADLARAEAAIAEGQKLLIVASKTLAYQEARLEDTVLYAPFEGLLVSRDRDPGDIVVPGSSIYQLIGLDEIWVSAWVDETAMASLAPNQEARVILRSEPDRTYVGRVVRLGRETDPETREFIVDVAMEQLPDQWAIGQRAEAFIETRRLASVLTVPLTYVSVVEGERGVFINRNGKATWVRCEFGEQGREMVEVREGVEPGEVVVRPMDPDARVQMTDGRRVIVH